MTATSTGKGLNPHAPKPLVRLGSAHATTPRARSGRPRRSVGGERLPVTPCAALLSLGALLLASSAHADERRTARLSYTRGPGAEQCADEDVIRRQIAKDLGHSAFSDDARLRLTVTITRGKDVFVAVVEAKGEGAPTPPTRRVIAPTCDQLTDLLTTVLSILIDPDPPKRPRSEPAPAPEPAPALAPKPAPASAPAPAPEPEPAPAPRLEFSAGLAAHVALGTGPISAPGVDVRIALRRAWFSLALEGRWDAPIDADAITVDTRKATISSQLLASTLYPCVHHWILVGCGLVSLGERRVYADVRGTPDDDNKKSLYFALGVRVGLELQLWKRLSGRIAIDLPFPLLRTPHLIRTPAFGPSGFVAPVWTPSPVSAALGLGLAVNFL
jgi:hypothetical protein